MLFLAFFTPDYGQIFQYLLLPMIQPNPTKKVTTFKIKVAESKKIFAYAPI